MRQGAGEILLPEWDGENFKELYFTLDVQNGVISFAA
jgi:hypothetical protein